MIINQAKEYCKMIKILAVGNSFSQDATFYLYDIAKCGGIDVKVGNLWIGGCSLETHWKNITENVSLHEYEINGCGTGRMCSVKDALISESWDFVTMQQVSGKSGIVDTYYPYIRLLSDYIREHVPDVTQMIHKTWAYEAGCTHEDFPKYNNDPALMYRSLSSAYDVVSGDLGIKLIPSGDVINALNNLPEFDPLHGGQSLFRDGFHLDLIYGRYAAALTWYKHVLTGNVLSNDFIPIGAEPDLLQLIKIIVHET